MPNSTTANFAGRRSPRRTAVIAKVLDTFTAEELRNCVVYV